ncbi:MAG: hypothetical protein IJO19_03865 [Clostridia bacterium]|nr:hypothetical protein [Clostridia bacterium]
MREEGLFRTKIFGGFNKKDVFEYFDTLKSQIQDENSDLIEKSSKQTEEIEQDKQKISELESKVNILQKNAEDLEQENKKLLETIEEIKQNNLKISELESKNSSLTAELFKVNSQLIEENKYKSHCNELSRKIIKIESEMLVKDSKIKKMQDDFQNLITKLKELPELDEDMMINAKDSITTLAQILGSANILIEAVTDLKKEINKD